MSFYIDLTELLSNPRKTGIERISGEICRNLPPRTAIPIRINADHYVTLPPTLIDIIGGYFRDDNGAGATEIRRLGAVEKGSALKLSPRDTVLIPEIFGDPRTAFFRSLSEQELQQHRFIVYDLLPVTHPEFFSPEMPLVMSGYFQILRRTNHCGFISEHTREVYYGRLRRTDAREGVVLPLGCDALGPRAERPTLNRPLSFTVLGTIEPRKNHQLILEAFEALLRQIEGLSLSFIGKMGWVDSEFAQKVRTLAAEENSGFRFHSAPDDEAIRRHIEESRATIYISSTEGYGLPPVESLWVGTPVIASATIPSLTRLGTAGIHYVDPLNVINLRRAVLAFLDDGYANRKTEETIHLNLPTWRSFTEEVLRWCSPHATTS